MSTLATFTVALLLAQSPGSKADRERHPLAPSLPVLTAKETAAYEAIVARFIQYDIGKLPKTQGARAKDDFLRLPPEAIFVLIEGFNQAATMEDSCPAVLIGKKIASILRSTEDVDLLNFAKAMIGADVKVRRHMGVVKDLQLTCILRKGYLQKQRLAAGAGSGTPPPAATTFGKMTEADFIAGAKTEQGPKLKSILEEAAKRKLFGVFIVAAARPETEARELGQEYLDKHLEKAPASQLRDLLKHTRAEARVAAAKAIGARKLALGVELIDTLADESVTVRQAARKALVRLADGQDFGPAEEATVEERTEAIRRWRAWSAKAHR